MSMSKRRIKQIIQNLPNYSPELLEYLRIAQENDWDDIKDLISIKLGLKEEDTEEDVYKKTKKKISETLREILKPLGKKKIEGTWDYSVDFLDAKKVLIDAYKRLYDMNLMPEVPYEAYVAILLIQLVNCARIGEAIRAFKTFVESNQREFQLQAEKRGNMKFFIIPSVIKNRPSYREILLIPDDKLQSRIRMFARKYLECNTHSLRYACISFLSKTGTSAQIIAKISGHRDYRYIEKYTQTKDAVEIQRRIAESK